MMEMSGSPANGRSNGSYRSDSQAVDVTSPSLRRNVNGSRTTMTNQSTTTAAAPSEPNLFSPRSAAAMALSSISQIFSTETQTVATRHQHHPVTTTGTRAMPSRDNATSSSLAHPHSVRSVKTSDYKMADGSTMTHPQLPPPQSLFRSSTKAASSTSKDSSFPSYNENDYDGSAPLPFIPKLPPTDSRMVNRDAPPPPHHHHTGIPYASHHDTEPHLQPHAPPYYYTAATASQQAMMMMMKRQQSFPPSSMQPNEQPSQHSTYTSPQQRSHMMMMTSNHHTGASNTSIPHSHVKQHSRPYDLESQMLPSTSRHCMMTMVRGQSHLQQQEAYPLTATTTVPTAAAMTPAAGMKRDISSSSSMAAHIPNHWTTLYHPPPQLPTPNNSSSMPHINHGTPSHNNHSNVAMVANDHHHLQQQQQEHHHQNTTPYHPIHRCSSYGSASSNQNTTHYDVGPSPQQQQQHQPQFLPPPPPPQVVTSGPYHPRSVSWSNNEPLQWIPYSGPPVSETRHFPVQSQLIKLFDLFINFDRFSFDFS